MARSRRSTGQIIARPDGHTFLVRAYRGRSAGGKRQYVSKTVKGSRKDAQRALTQLLSHRDNGTLPEPTRRTVGQYVSEWLEVVAKPRVSGVTLAGYEKMHRLYIRPALGDIKLARLTPDAIERTYADMRARGLSTRIVRHTHAVLRAACRTAVERNVLPRNPATLATLPRQERREMHALGPDEARRFLTAAESDRYYALWLLLLHTGMRPNEATALKWSDLTEDAVRVQRSLVPGYRGTWEVKEPKTSRGRRVIPVPPEVMVAFRSHRQQQLVERLAAGSMWTDRGFIFTNAIGDPLDIRSTRRSHFNAILGRAGLGHIRIYDLRHTHATLLLGNAEHPKVVAERLGHASIVLTMDTYSHVLPTMQQGATDRLSKLLARSA